MWAVGLGIIAQRILWAVLGRAGLGKLGQDSFGPDLAVSGRSWYWVELGRLGQDWESLPREFAGQCSRLGVIAQRIHWAMLDSAGLGRAALGWAEQLRARSRCPANSVGIAWQNWAGQAWAGLGSIAQRIRWAMLGRSGLGKTWAELGAIAQGMLWAMLGSARLDNLG